MTKKNIYEAFIQLISNPDSLKYWVFLEKTYKDLNLLEESRTIKYYIDNRFEEEEKHVDDSNFGEKQ